MEIFQHSGICPVRDIISRLSSKWGMLVLITLNSNKKMRFNDIQKSIGDISQRMLTVTLRTLEADGLLSRKVYPEVPPKVEYALTPRGESLIPHIKALVDWALSNSDSILNDRKNSERS